MEVSHTYRLPQFARSLTAQIYSLCREESPLTSDLTIFCGDGWLHTQALTLFVAFPYLRQLVSVDCLGERLTLFLPDHSQSELRRALHQLYTAGNTQTLAFILGLTDINSQEMEGPDMLSSHSDWDEEVSLDEAQEEFFDQQEYLDTSEEEEEEDSDGDSLEDEDEDSLTGEYKAKQSQIFLTSTECKRSPIKSLGRARVEGLGLCFVSPISKDYEEPEPESEEGEGEDIWDNFIKTSLVSLARPEEDPEDESINLGSSFSQSPLPPSPPLLEKLLEQTTAGCLTKLTNIELWLQHFEAILTQVSMEDSLADLSPSLILKYLETLNDRFSEKFPSVFPRDQKKNCFGKLADILIKRLPIIFGDYLNTKDIEKFSFEQHNMNTEMEEIEEYPPELMSDTRSQPQAEILAERLRDQNHGAHTVDVIVDKEGSGQPLIICDGYTFRSKSGRRSRLTFLNNYYKCTFRSCRAFIKIREGRLVSCPTSKSVHSNHHKK